MAAVVHVDEVGGVALAVVRLAGAPQQVASFGEDPDGELLVAGFDGKTHKVIAALLQQKLEPLPGTGFYVAPNLSYLQQIAEASGQERLQALLELFAKHINVHDEFFLPANLSDQIEKAKWLDTLKLPLEDRFLFSLCPVSTKIAMLEQALQDWAECRAKGKQASLLRMEGRGGRNELQFLEDTCKLYSAYAWLSYRMPETFPHGDMAQSLMQSTSEKIDALLQVQNTRHRQQRKHQRAQNEAELQ